LLAKVATMDVKMVNVASMETDVKQGHLPINVAAGDCTEKPGWVDEVQASWEVDAAVARVADALMEEWEMDEANREKIGKIPLRSEDQKEGPDLTSTDDQDRLKKLVAELRQRLWRQVVDEYAKSCQKEGQTPMDLPVDDVNEVSIINPAEWASWTANRRQKATENRNRLPLRRRFLGVRGRPRGRAVLDPYSLAAPLDNTPRSATGEVMRYQRTFRGASVLASKDLTQAKKEKKTTPKKPQKRLERVKYLLANCQPIWTRHLTVVRPFAPPGVKERTRAVHYTFVSNFLPPKEDPSAMVKDRIDEASK